MLSIMLSIMLVAGLCCVYACAVYSPMSDSDANGGTYTPMLEGTYYT